VSELNLQELNAFFTVGDVQSSIDVLTPCNYGPFILNSGLSPHITFTLQNTMGAWETFTGTFTPTLPYDHVTFGSFDYDLLATSATLIDPIATKAKVLLLNNNYLFGRGS
jgi:hypothetical protein